MLEGLRIDVIDESKIFHWEKEMHGSFMMKWRIQHLTKCGVI